MNEGYRACGALKIVLCNRVLGIKVNIGYWANNTVGVLSIGPTILSILPTILLEEAVTLLIKL